MVSDADDEFKTVPLARVVAVIVNVPVHVPLGMIIGNDTLFNVLAGSVNGGVVKITDCVLLHLFGCNVPFSVNLTEIF